MTGDGVKRYNFINNCAGMLHIGAVIRIDIKVFGERVCSIIHMETARKQSSILSGQFSDVVIFVVTHKNRILKKEVSDMRRTIKKIISCLIVSMMLTVVVGCNSSAKKKWEPVSVETVVTEEESYSEKTSEVVESNSEVSSENSVNNDAIPLSEVTPEYAKEHHMVCLWRDGKLYSLGPSILRKEENSLVKVVGSFPVNKTQVLSATELSAVHFNKATDRIYNYNSQSLNVYHCKYVSDTIFLFWSDTYDDYIVMDDYKPLVLQRVDSVDVKDSNGRTVADFTKLDLNKDYKVSWYQGMDYREITMKANWCLYNVDEKPFTTISGQMTKNSYAIVNLQSLPSGTYHIGMGDFISPIIID